MSAIQEAEARLRALGINPEDIKRQGQESKTAESMLGSFKRGVARTARDAAAGAAGIYDLAALPFNLFGAGIPSGSAYIERKIDETTGGYTAPRTPTEKTVSAITQAVSGMGPAKIGFQALSTLAKPGKIKKLLSAFSEGNKYNPVNTGSTVAASGVTQHLLNENPDDQIGAFLGGLGAGFVTPTAMNAPARFLRATTKTGRTQSLSDIGSKLNINKKKVQALNDAGIPLTLDAVTDSVPVMMFTNMMEKSPFTSSSILKARQAQNAAIVSGTGFTDELMTQLNPLRGGTLSKEGVQATRLNKDSIMKEYNKKRHEALLGGWNDNLDQPKITEALEYGQGKYDSFTTPTAKKDFEETLVGQQYAKSKKMAEEFAGMADSPEIITKKNRLNVVMGEIDSLPDSLKGRRDINPINDLYNVAENLEREIKSLSKSGEHLVPIKDLRQQRELINKKLEGEYGQISSAEKTELKDYNRALRIAEERFYDQVPEAGAIQRERNKWYSNYKKQVEEPILDPILKAGTPHEKGSFTALYGLIESGSNVDPIFKFLSEKDAKELSTTVFKRLGTIGKNGEFDIHRMAKEFKKLPKTSQETLLSSFGEDDAKKFLKIMKGVDILSEQFKHGNPPQSGFIRNLGSMVESGQKVAGVAIGAMIGANPIKAIETTIKFAAPIVLTKYIVNKVVVNSNTLNTLADAMSVTEKNAPNFLYRLSKRKGVAARTLFTEIQSLLHGGGKDTPSAQNTDIDELEQAKARLVELGIDPDSVTG